MTQNLSEQATISWASDSMTCLNNYNIWGELAELYVSSELYLKRLIFIYLVNIWEELAKLNASSELYPTRFTCIYLADIWEELVELY